MTGPRTYFASRCNRCADSVVTTPAMMRASLVPSVLFHFFIACFLGGSRNRGCSGERNRSIVYTKIEQPCTVPRTYFASRCRLSAAAGVTTPAILTASLVPSVSKSHLAQACPRGLTSVHIFSLNDDFHYILSFKGDFYLTYCHSNVIFTLYFVINSAR